ncbi:MAG: ABC transporter permease subunit [bacterium]|nr:ABC transporter permease subunit [bacterium]
MQPTGTGPARQTQAGSQAASSEAVTTPFRVRVSDPLMGMLIAVGGVGTILALLLVVMVLVFTALPLVRPARIGDWHQIQTDGSYQHIGCDSGASLSWGMLSDGRIEVRSLQDGALVANYGRPAESPEISCSSLSIDQRTLALGLEDGSFLTAAIQFQEELLAPAELPAEIRVSRQNPIQRFNESVFEWLDDESIRRVQLAPIVWSSRMQLADSRLTAIDYVEAESLNAFGSNSQAQVLAVAAGESTAQLVRGELQRSATLFDATNQIQLETESIDIRSRAADHRPLRIMLASGNQHALVLWPNGTLDRYSDFSDGFKIRESQSTTFGDSSVTSAAPLLGRQVLMCGTSDGRLQGWTINNVDSIAGPDTTVTQDGFELSLSHDMQISQAPLQALISSQRTQVAAVADAQSRVGIVYLTTDRLIGMTAAWTTEVEAGEPKALALSPLSSAIFACNGRELAFCSLDAEHPESSWRTYFGQVWYQGHDRPKYIWQSTAASENSELKLSLIPLLFGTLKAATFAMLISLPIALLAAIYTSEFLSSKIRSYVKPMIELMATIPGVVLGYIAAVIIAPLTDQLLMPCLAAVFLLPLCFLCGGRLWRAFQSDPQTPARGAKRLPWMLILFPLALWLSFHAGSAFEKIFFTGDFANWITTGQGTAVGGWILLLAPVCTPVCIYLAKFLQALLAEVLPWQGKKPRAAVYSVLPPIYVALGIFLLSWLAGQMLTWGGWDPRLFLFLNYQNPNALLVGAALGFGIIPVIFTLADDALHSVPAQQRNASLACGASRWQTTLRIVIPAAASGLLSAVMLGFARAAGETMVVLMVGGNTPIMEWNPFSGLRALTATLATELPQAIKGSTHYRTLFLAAICLFAITLIANTAAELIRNRIHRSSSRL